ncbi:MAG: phenylalanine--tRNA ligase beta subunit-related protein, partial [Microgenomates group bacterium]
MNIKITYNWLLEYLDTDADPYEIQKYLSLCGPGVERIEKVSTKGGLTDYVFDIEITSNRVDMASVFGIAQEAQAILPQFGKKAKLRQNPLTELRFKWIEKFSGEALPLILKVEDKKFAERLIVVALSNVTIQPSDKLIKERLEMCDERSLNNVVDISNYMRIAIGQPCHIFDYDEVKKHTMIVRESTKGEKIMTLDKETVTLPGKDIVIADGEGNLIDQPGIMGGFNSSIQKKTKNIILLIPVFNGAMVRRTAMLTGKRSNAVAYFEKNIDDDRAESATVYCLNLLKQYAGAKQASPIEDYHPTPSKKKIIEVDHQFIESRIGIKIKPAECKRILENLGFHTRYD